MDILISLMTTPNIRLFCIMKYSFFAAPAIFCLSVWASNSFNYQPGDGALFTQGTFSKKSRRVETFKLNKAISKINGGDFNEMLLLFGGIEIPMQSDEVKYATSKPTCNEWPENLHSRRRKRLAKKRNFPKKTTRRRKFNHQNDLQSEDTSKKRRWSK